MRAVKKYLLLISVFCLFMTIVRAQEQPPAPSAPKPVKVPAVSESKLANGLSVSVVQRSASPIVTVNFLVRRGASAEPENKAGLAYLTASMLSKGTKTRSATEIAEAIEFLGGSISSGASWNNSVVSVTVTSDKVAQAMAIMSDLILHPKFDQEELDLLKSQTLDGLAYNLKQPSSLAGYVASKYSFGEHPAGGTPASIASITKADIEEFYANNYLSDYSFLIFTGNITALKASAAARQYLGSMKKYVQNGPPAMRLMRLGLDQPASQALSRILVIDLPKSGQASVGYYKRNTGGGLRDTYFYEASVMNSVLGGGYSSRLNMEIRIKRGLSYGAGSNFAWRNGAMNFSARAQTKNESAAQVAELVLTELKRLTAETVSIDELTPRKSVLTGTFGRNLETSSGLATALAELYTFYVPSKELNSYVTKVNGVTGAQVRSFASQAMLGGDIVIVGDYSIFKDDLAKRFPGMKVEVISADDLDLSKDSLRK